MRRMHPGFLLLCLATPVQADWSLMGGATDIYSAYADKATIHKVDEGSGDFRSMWGLYDFSRTDVSVTGAPHQSTRSLREYDCTGVRVRLMSFEDYSEHMGTGKMISAGGEPGARPPGRWEPVIPGAVDEAFWKAACAK